MAKRILSILSLLILLASTLCFDDLSSNLIVLDRGGDPGTSVGQSLTLGLRGSDRDKTRGHLFFALDADQKFVGAHSAQSINDGRWRLLKRAKRISRRLPMELGCHFPLPVRIMPWNEGLLSRPWGPSPCRSIPGFYRGFCPRSPLGKAIH